MRKTWIFAVLAFAVAAILSVQSLGAEDKAELHQVLLEYLRSSDLTVPRPLPEIHPVRTVFNHEAIIPPMCYTRTEGQHNPCYVCHQNQRPHRENVMNDGDLQLEYSFSDVGMTNHWENLFEDRSAEVDAISDSEIMVWVDTDNYSALAAHLRKESFDGWIPDLKNLHLGADAFDEYGFAKDGSHWVAFNYKPMPSTFWPTNGATDDVMIRLPEAFRSDDEGNYSADVYRANLAITEAVVKGLNEIDSLPFDEARVGRDLDGDGKLGITTQVSAVDSYVGAAAIEFIDASLYPEGTEFLHTVRYLGITEDGEIVPSKRMKEVRYMRKTVAYRKSVYERHYILESFAKEAGHLPQYTYLGDNGLDNGSGWAIQGFIEGRSGELRAATYEENLFCMGCHSSIGSTIDKTFSFPRKVDGARGWGYIDLRNMPDVPNMGEADGEILTYLRRAGGGGEFRSNPEMRARWFHSDGTLDVDRVTAAADVYELITPSITRALQLNKAYKVIVDNQDFIYGRDATITPPENVYEFIDNKTAPTLPAELFHAWDMRLDWSAID